MLSYWDRVRRKREKCEGVATMGDRYDAIKALDDALTPAMPCFNPFGKCDKGKTHRLKDWHIPAILIADVVTKALVASGDDAPSLARNSAVVAVVHQALCRMRYPNIKMVTHSAVSGYLIRWTTDYGRSFR
jgi:hypothetical protein